MDRLILTPDELKSIAESNELGHDVYLNSKTKEIIELPNVLNDPMSEYNEFFDEAREKVESNWHDIVKIECPSASETYDIMASYVADLPDQHALKSNLARVLNESKPFRKFNHIIHQSELRMSWFRYRTKMLEERARRIIEGMKYG